MILQAYKVGDLVTGTRNKPNCWANDGMFPAVDLHTLASPVELV